MMMIKKQTILLSFLFCMQTLSQSASAMTLFGSKKDKKETTKPVQSDYNKLVGRDTMAIKGLMGVIQKENDYYLEIPKTLIGREILVSNKLLQVPQELNEAGVNKGINYENKTIKFEWEKGLNKLNIREQRLTPEVYSFYAMAPSVKDNYINPLIASLKIEGVGNFHHY